MEGRKEMFSLMMHSLHFYLWLYGIRYILKDHSDREETHCHHYMDYSFRLAARDHLYAPSHRHDQDSIYHGLCYTSCGAPAGMRNNPFIHNEGLI